MQTYLEGYFYIYRECCLTETLVLYQKHPCNQKKIIWYAHFLKLLLFIFLQLCKSLVLCTGGIQKQNGKREKRFYNFLHVFNESTLFQYNNTSVFYLQSRWSHIPRTTTHISFPAEVSFSSNSQT